jgi:hypothetical protein
VESASAKEGLQVKQRIERQERLQVTCVKQAVAELAVILTARVPQDATKIAQLLLFSAAPSTAA